MNMPITFDPADYWRLRAATADMERAQLQAVLAEQQLQTARTKRQAVWAELADKYGLDMARPYGARDEDCVLMEA